MLDYKKILVPLDFSEDSAIALDWAVRLARTKAGSSIILCHVIKSAVAPVGPETTTYDFEAMLRESAEKDLARWREKIPSSVQSHAVLGKGRVSEEATRICQKENIDLIVMTTHGRTGLSHWVLGSAAEETVRLAPCPVIVLHVSPQARKEAGPKTRQILVPVDFSDESRLSVQWACHLAQGVPNAIIYLCHVIPPDPLGLREPEVVAFDYSRMEKKEARKKLTEWEKLIPERIRAIKLLGYGDPAAEIARLCREHQVDLVVMTTRGLQGFKHLIHPSTTEKTVRFAPCPVLVLHLTESLKKGLATAG